MVALKQLGVLQNFLRIRFFSVNEYSVRWVLGAVALAIF